jgi:hypothetical protein
VISVASTSVLALLLCFANLAESVLAHAEAVAPGDASDGESSPGRDSAIFSASKISVPVDVSGRLVAGTPYTLALVIVPHSHCESLEVEVTLAQGLALAGGVSKKVFSNPAPDKPVTFDLAVTRSGRGPYHVVVGLKLKWADGLGPAGFKDVVVSDP